MPEANCEIVVHRLVVQEIFLDHVAAISQAEHKVGKTVVRIQLHDVPEDRSTTNFYQRFGPVLSLLSQACTESTAKHHHFHEILLDGAGVEFTGFPKLYTLCR